MYPENGTHTVAAYTAMDPEGEDITWTLKHWRPTRTTSPSRAAFSPSMSPPDFEAANADTTSGTDATHT